MQAQSETNNPAASASTQAIRTEIRDQVLIVTIDTPGERVNTLGESMIGEFEGLMDLLERDPALKGALIVSGKRNSFIAGADIGLFQTRTTAAELEELSLAGHRMMDRIAGARKPIVIGIHGACMGGGTELALACHYRIVTQHPSTAIGLPEVQLGILPGMGGTQRLPRLIGVQKALTYMLTGRKMYARQARRNGFADEVVHAYGLQDAGIRAVHKMAGRTGPRNDRSGDQRNDQSGDQRNDQHNYQRKDRRSLPEKLLEGTAAGRAIVFRQALRQTLATTKGNYPAPPKIIESVQYGLRHGLEKGLRNEARLFGELAETPESRALVQLFFGMTGAKKNPQASLARPVKHVAVLGAGLMGSGIAEVTSKKGVHVWLKDRDLEQAFKGKQLVENNIERSRKRRIYSGFVADRLRSVIHPVDSYYSFGQTNVVIEAVFEDLDLKRRILREVEEVTREDTIFATNTSSLPIAEIAAEATRPEHVVGMHYFSPVQKMPLLEIIKTEKTADWVTATAYDVGMKQGKTVIVVNDGPGFYTTRILAPLMNEALLLLEEGAYIDQIDKAMRQFGFPVGPVTLFDEVGIDVGAHVAEVLGPTFRERGARTSTKAKELLDAGFMGRKNGRGFYVYDDGGVNGSGGKRGGKSSSKGKRVNTEIYTWLRPGGVANNGSRSGSATNPDSRFTDKELQDRISMMMINEALYCLQEGILNSPTDGDLGAVLGLGFPPFLGGPFRMIDRFGATEILRTMETLAASGSPRFTPAPILADYAKANKRFHRD